VNELNPTLGLRRPCLIQKPLEPARIDGFLLGGEDVAGRPRLDHVRAENLAQLRDRILESGRRRPRGSLSPKIRDQTLAWNDLADVHREHREHCTLPLTAELKGLLSVPHLERTKDPKLEHFRVVTPFSARA
jgi:hypothetical protein